LQPGQVILLENLRFHAEETGQDVSKDAVEQFRKFLSSLADVYVQDAFGAIHRHHSSILGIGIPIRAAGLLMMKELDYFSEALEDPQRPLLAIIGGSSLADKKDVIRHLITKVDVMIVGGAPAFTFKKFLQNVSIGSSAICEDLEGFVKEIEVAANARGVRLYFPMDYVIADRSSCDAAFDFADDSTGILFFFVLFCFFSFLFLFSFFNWKFFHNNN
jgi:phosphoglycerate kinase